MPAMSEREVPSWAANILVTNTRGKLVLTKKSLDGVARFGFSQVPLKDEPPFFGWLFTQLWDFSSKGEWSNRCSTLTGALDLFVGVQFKPKTLVLAESLVTQFGVDRLGVSAKRLEGVKVIHTPESNLPEGSAILTADPEALGVYTRVGDYLGLQFLNAQHTMVLVNTNGLVG